MWLQEIHSIFLFLFEHTMCPRTNLVNISELSTREKLLQEKGVRNAREWMCVREKVREGERERVREEEKEREKNGERWWERDRKKERNGDKKRERWRVCQ